MVAYFMMFKMEFTMFLFFKCYKKTSNKKDMRYSILPPVPKLGTHLVFALY